MLNTHCFFCCASRHACYTKLNYKYLTTLKKLYCHLIRANCNLLPSSHTTCIYKYLYEHSYGIRHSLYILLYVHSSHCISLQHIWYTVCRCMQLCYHLIQLQHHVHHLLLALIIRWITELHKQPAYTLAIHSTDCTLSGGVHTGTSSR